MADADDALDTGPYQALYRRYRPQRFAEVLGQDHVTRALRHAVRDGRVAHAYLFSGPRGTGKTSTARILAMALNCENPVDGEPDTTCPSCVAIRQGSSLDVQELDSATNRGIDEMRDLLGRIALGTPGRWKVYIIDEVHQMTSAASSALLKTLEEPPAHVIFVLATTDPQKVLPTIRSRTQHFEFHLLGPDVLASLLRDVNAQASLGVPPEAIDLVVRRGHGSARDALSALDQVAAAGTVDDEGAVITDLVDAIADQDPAKVLLEVATAVTAGRDPRRVGADLIEHLRNGFLAVHARSLVLVADDAADEAAAQARRLGNAALVRAMEVVGQALIDMHDSVDPRVTLEVALVRLTSPEVDDSRAALLERIERLERIVAAGGPTDIPSVPGRPGSAPVQSTPIPPNPVPSRSEPPPLPPGSQPPVRVASGQGQASGPPADVPSGPSPPASGGQSALGAHRTPRQARPRPGPPGPPVGLPADPSLPAARLPADPSPASGGPSVADPSSEEHSSARASASASADASTSLDRSAADDSSDSSDSSLSDEGRRPVPSGAVRPGPGRSSASGPLPTREALTLAWGDDVLPKLRPAVKIYLATGRFVSVDEFAAVYAVPDKGLLARAEPNRAEVEAALAAHFGTPVPLRLVLDDASVVASPTRPAGAEDWDASAPPDLDEFRELQDAPSAVMSPEQRLLEAFPGAEEV